jgi:glycosyltransferase involved in cell wall biosynthesis
VQPIKKRYFLSVSAPVVIDSKGRRWCNELWAKDLALHLDYITNLTLGCPVEFREPGELDVLINGEPFDRIRFIDFPFSRSHLEALLNLPRFLFSIWRGVSSCAIVHTGFGGWPISEGWVAVPIGKVLGRYVITNVESSFWRAQSNASLLQRIRGWLIECGNRFCVRLADLKLFTSQAYAKEFLRGGDRRAYVVPATWVDTEVILSEDEALDAWNSKAGRVRLLFAGRLIEDKGVNVLLGALRAVASLQSEPLEVTIIGNGELRQACLDLAQELKSSQVQVLVFEPVSYGPLFFNLLREYDAVLLPSLSDEQPRLIFDAFSQAVPILGSNTGGIGQVVCDQINGKLFSPDNVDAFATNLVWASTNRPALQAMGMQGRRDCEQFTHHAMHSKRHQILLKELALAGIFDPDLG